MEKAGSEPRKLGSPLWVNAEITYKCPLHCVFCYNPTDYTQYGPELTTEDWLRVFRQARELGGRHQRQRRDARPAAQSWCGFQ